MEKDSDLVLFVVERGSLSFLSSTTHQLDYLEKKNLSNDIYSNLLLLEDLLILHCIWRNGNEFY